MKKPFVKLRLWGEPYFNGVVFATGTDNNDIDYCVCVGYRRDESHESA